MPSLRFTDRWLRGHKAKGREEWNDTAAPGLLVRFGAEGSAVFYARFRHEGRYVRKRIGSFPEITLVDARDEVRDMKNARERDEPIGGEDTVAALAAAFLRSIRARKERGAAEVERILSAYVLPVIGDRPAASIRQRDVTAILDAAMERGAPVQANRIRSHLIQLFRWGLERERVEMNPAQLVSKPFRERARERVLSDAELVAFWRGLEIKHPTLRNLFRFLLLTALRPGEARLLEWGNVDGGELRLPAAVTKAGRDHLLPLPALAMSVIEAQRGLDLPGALVFPSTTGGPDPFDPSSLSHFARKLGDRLGFSFRPHDLRRTCATGIAALGYSREVVRRVLNHADPEVTGRYDRHGYGREVAEAMGAWADHVQALLDQSRSPAIHRSTSDKRQPTV